MNSKKIAGVAFKIYRAHCEAQGGVSIFQWIDVNHIVQSLQCMLATDNPGM